MFISSAVCVAVLTCADADAADPIETVIVHAQKRATALADVPMSVTTFSDKELADIGLDDLHELAAHTAVLDMQQSVGAATATLRIRRIGTLGNVPTLEPAVGLFVDGAYRQRSFLVADLLDVGRIEILAGPQSTLYGRNVSAGVVAIYTRTPPTRPEVWGEVTRGVVDMAGSPDILNVKAGIGGPLSSAVSATLAGGYSQHDHTMLNALPGMPDGENLSRSAWRGQMRWAGDTLEMRLIGGYQREHDDQGEADVCLAPGSPTAMTAATLVERGLAADCPDNIPNNRRTCSVAANTLDLTALDLTLIADGHLRNGWTLTSTTAWDRYHARRTEDDTVQLFAPILYFHDVQDGDAFQEELRVASPVTDRLSWLAGLFYYRNTFERGDRGREGFFGPNGPLAYDSIWPVPFALPDQDGMHDSRTTTRYASAFSEATWKMTQRMDLIAGLRWHKEHRDASIANSVTRPGASIVADRLTPAVSPSGAPVNGAVQRSSDAITWSATSRFHVSDSLMAYATLARGSKPGGFNNATGNAPLTAREFDDEDIRHLEVGARFKGHGARISLTAFRTNYHDYQDTVFSLTQFGVGNVEQLNLAGVELDLQAALGENTAASLAASYVDVKYRHHTTGMCYPGRTPDGSQPGSCDLSGERPLNAPPWEIHLGLEHTIPAPWGSVFSRIDWSWIDSYNTTFSADPRLVQRAYHDVGARLGIRLGEAYELALWGRNLLDENVVQMTALLNMFNDASWQSFLGDPRSFGVTLRARF